MKFKDLLKDKKGVFGLNAVQLFFATILGISLLAYIIVVVMGVLGGTTILTQSSGSVTNETGAYVNTTGYTLAQSTLDGFANPTITAVINVTNTSETVILASGNYTLVGNVLYNNSAVGWNNVSVSYSYNYNSAQQNELNSILSNTSTGITGFFSSINPVYAILAVLVIILILVVLVRVVQSPNRQEGSVQL